MEEAETKFGFAGGQIVIAYFIHMIQR